MFVLSAPSGAGKTTVAKRVLSSTPNLIMSISHTTRPMRDEEADGADYHFVDEEKFRKMIENNEFLEWAQVHGAFYGTSFRAVGKSLIEKGVDMLLDIDVQGAETLRGKDVDCRSIFLLPPSIEELERRLAARGTESAQKLKVRLEAARAEIGHKEKFDYIVVNNDLDRAVEEVREIIASERVASR